MGFFEIIDENVKRLSNVCKELTTLANEYMEKYKNIQIELAEVKAERDNELNAVHIQVMEVKAERDRLRDALDSIINLQYIQDGLGKAIEISRKALEPSK